MQLAHQTFFSLGALEVRPATCEVVSPHGREVLQPRVMQVLAHLAQANGAVVSRDDLIADCWDGRIVGDDAITLVMVKVRKLAARSGAFAVETIPRIGYRLVTTEPVKPLAPQAGAARGAKPNRRRVVTLATAGAAAAGLAGAGVFAWNRLPREAATTLTIAVLPFDDLSPGQASRFLAAGLARQLRNSLSRVAGLSVIADASSFALAGQNLVDADIAKRLKARLLLRGSVTQSGDSVRITTELVDMSSAVQVWADTKESTTRDLFALQDEVAGAVIQELIGRAGSDQIKEPPAARRRNPEVFRIMLGADQLVEQTRALRMVGREAEASDAADEAQLLVDQALAIDPRDVGALVVQASLTRNGWTRRLAAQPLSSAQRGAAAALLLTRAIAIDPNDPSALAALADCYRRLEWRWSEAEALFRRALAIDANHLEAHWGYCYQLALLGRGLEGLVHARALMRLDPETVWRRLTLPRLYYVVGARDAAMQRWTAELALHPDNLFLIRELYFVHLSETDTAGLVALIRRMRDELWKGRRIPPGIEALLARAAAAVEALNGHPAELIKLVDADITAFDAGGSLAGTRQGRASVDFLFIYAMEYGWAGETVLSIALLDRALAARSTYWPPSLPFGPAHFPPKVRSAPAYAAIWRAEPKRVELVASRLAALKRGQMAGFLPDGRKVTPRIPADSQAREV